GMRFAVGSIRYPGSAVPGWLLYLKPTYQGTERADIRSYASGSPDFPHESTTDQWFSESQLESYRALGATIAEFVCSGGRGVAPEEKPADLTLEELESLVKDLLGGPPRAHWQPAPAASSRATQAAGAASDPASQAAIESVASSLASQPPRASVDTSGKG